MKCKHCGIKIHKNDDIKSMWKYLHYFDEENANVNVKGGYWLCKSGLTEFAEPDIKLERNIKLERI
jgi:hypothetical protein